MTNVEETKNKVVTTTANFFHKTYGKAYKTNAFFFTSFFQFVDVCPFSLPKLHEFTGWSTKHYKVLIQDKFTATGKQYLPT